MASPVGHTVLVLQADTRAFYAALKKANKALKAFETRAKKSGLKGIKGKVRLKPSKSEAK